MPTVARRTLKHGIEFGPTLKNARLYISLFKHRGSGSPIHKSVWAITIAPPAEYELFEESDTQEWSTQDGDHWAVHDGGNTVLGTNGQRLCRFPVTSNASDPWHGFPVSPLSRQADTPELALLDKWVADGIINRPFAKRVLKAKV